MILRNCSVNEVLKAAIAIWMQSKISLIAGVKGVSKSNSDGINKVQLNDIFSVFSKIKGTPKYWQVARNDLIAKVKQLGPFHIFFTFSCGEKRWTEVFVTLLKKRGYKVEFPINWDGDEADRKTALGIC